MKKAQWLDRCLLESPYFYTLCTTKKHFRKVLRHLRIKKSSRPSFLSTEHANATVHFFQSCGPDKHAAVVCIGGLKGRNRLDVLALLVHEAVHIWQEIRAVYGESCAGREEEAYSVQRIAQSLFYEYERQTA